MRKVDRFIRTDNEMLLWELQEKGNDRRVKPTTPKTHSTGHGRRTRKEFNGGSGGTFHGLSDEPKTISD